MRSTAWLVPAHRDGEGARDVLHPALRGLVDDQQQVEAAEADVALAPQARIDAVPQHRLEPDEVVEHLTQLHVVSFSPDQASLAEDVLDGNLISANLVA